LNRQHVRYKLLAVSTSCLQTAGPRQALKQLHSTAREMRRNDLRAGGLSLQVGFYDHVAFACNVGIEPCHDPYTLQEHLIAVWPRVPAYTPSDLSVALTHLDLAPSPRTSSALIRLTNRTRNSV
jgi:hypothetical protein